MLARLVRRPLTWVIVGVLAVAGGFGLYWFQPWKAFTTVTVNEALPEVPAPAADTAQTAGSPAPTGATKQPDETPNSEAPNSEPASREAPGTQPPRNELLRSGRLVTHEHETSGEVRLVRLADGRTQLVLKDLKTSDGPDVRVWLTDQRVDPADWHNFDDGRWVELGRIKGNAGNQVYDVPAGTDLGGLRSVSLWCKRFSVSFGAADLRAV